MTKEVMQQALDAFEAIMMARDIDPATTIAKNARYGLREALKQEQGETVATDWERIARVQNAKLMAMSDTVGGFEKLREVLDKYEDTTPKTKEWVGLTREDKCSIYIQCSNAFSHEPHWSNFANAVEAKLKELNT